MMKPILYLDTSAVSAYYDQRDSSRMGLTQGFWALLSEYDVVISDLVVGELKRVRDCDLREKLLSLVSDFRVAALDPASEELAWAYIAAGAFPTDYADDARHVAIAALSGAGFLVSWNFRHIVKVKTRRIVELVNAQRGLQRVEIIAPPEL